MATRVCVECKAVYTPSSSGAGSRCEKCSKPDAAPRVESGDVNATAEFILDPPPDLVPLESDDEDGDAPDRTDSASGDISDFPTMEIASKQAARTAPRNDAKTAPTKKLPVIGRGLPREITSKNQLGPYQILSEIGRGGMGVVLKCRDDALKREVAIKTLLPEARRNPTHELRFIQEAQIAGQLEHPGIAPVHLLSWDEKGNGFFSMKLVSGKSLETVLEKWHAKNAEIRADFPLTRLISIFERVCETIGYAHSHRVVHRDLKPANIMIGDYGEVLVLDWGLAKVLGEADLQNTSRSSKTIPITKSAEHPSRKLNKDLESNVTLDGTVVGTPGYMAPEQAAGDDIDEGVDIFGLGALLYEILTGSAPYTGKTIQEILANSAAGRTRAIPKTVRGRTIPSALAAIATKCVQRDRRDRYASATDLIHDLRAYAAGEPVSAIPDSADQRLKRFARRHGRALSWIGAGVALAASILIYAMVTANTEHSKRLEAEIASAEKGREAREADAAREVERERRLQAELDKQKTLASEAEKANRRLKAFEPYTQAMDLIMRGQLADKAADLLKHALTIDPEFVEAQFALGQALQLAGLPADAAAAYLKADQLQQNITGKPNLQALIAAGFTFDGAGSYEQAEDAFARTNKAGAGDPLALVGRVFQAEHAGRPKDGLQFAQQALKAAPHLWETHFAVGYALIEAITTGAAPQKPARADAIEELRKAYELSPRQPEVCFWLANALLSAGQRDEGLSYLERVIALEPRNGNRYIQRSILMTGRPRAEEDQDLAEAKRLGASEVLMLRSEAMRAYIEGDQEKGFQIMAKLVKVSHEWPAVVGDYLILAINMRRENDKEVTALFDRWARQNPDYFLVHALRAHLLLRKDPAQAIKEADAGLKTSPYSAQLFDSKAEASLILKDYITALDCSEKSLAANAAGINASAFKTMALAGLLRVAEAQAQLDDIKKKYPAQKELLDRLQSDINNASKYKAAQK